MRLIFLICFYTTALPHIQAQTNETVDVVNKFIETAKKEGFELAFKEKCDRPPGEMCKMPYTITPDITTMQVLVVGNRNSKPSLAIEDKDTHKVITFTIEDEVAPEQKVNYVSKRFNLHQSDLEIIFHYGNTRSFDTEDTFMLVFTQ